MKAALIFRARRVWAMPAEDSWFCLLAVLGHAFVSATLIAASYTFYASWDWRFVGLLAASTLAAVSAAPAQVDYDAMGRTTAVQTIQVAAGGEARVDWRVKVVADGEAVVRMKALTDEESDAVEAKFPCKVHGMLKTLS